jgi:iron complex outermembrane receptor protein
VRPGPDLRALLLAATAVAVAAGSAQAAPQQVRVHIARKPARTALIDLALQADLSLGGDLDACDGLSPALSGRMPLETALHALLDGERCTFNLPDAHTVVIRRRIARPPSPSPPHSPLQSPPVVVRPSPLGEIVVTAPRSPGLPGRTPYAISAISGAGLDRNQLRGLADLNSEIAGLTVTNLGPGRDKVLLRGLSDGAFTGQTQSVVALYLDDVPITYSAPDPNLRLVDIERVEVMRGPQGTLYGGGTIGGVIRVATRKPDLDRYGASLTVGLSDTQGGGPNTEVEATANLPVIAGRLAVRAVAYRDTQSGYIQNTRLDLDHVNRSQRDGARLTAKLALSPGWSALASITHQSINNEDTQYGLLRLGARQRDNGVREPHDNDFDHLSLTLNGEGRWGRLTASTARLTHQFDSRYDATSAITLFGGPAGPAASDEARQVELSVTEITYATPADHSLHGLVGAFFSSGETVTQMRLGPTSAPSGIATYAERRTDKINEAAIYGEGTWEMSDRWAATVGLRVFDFKYQAQSAVTQAIGARAARLNGDATGISPKFMVRYLSDGGQLFYAQVAEGYRPGGFNTAGQIGQVFNIPGAPQRRYGADELWNFEFGAKFQLFDGRVRARAAIFYATWEAIQSDQYLGDGVGFTANVGNGDNRGLEVEAAWRISEAWEVRGAALINDPQVTKTNLELVAQRDAGLPGIATISAGATVDYHRQLRDDLTLRLVGQAAYVGSSRLTFESEPVPPMGDYLVLRASTALETAGWTLSASIDNPFNIDANSFSFGNPFILRSDPVRTPVRPRTVAVRLTSRF